MLTMPTEHGVRACDCHDDLVASLKETRDAAAMLCRLIMVHAPELTEKLPSNYDGFGARADAIIAKAEGAEQ